MSRVLDDRLLGAPDKLSDLATRSRTVRQLQRQTVSYRLLERLYLGEDWIIERATTLLARETGQRRLAARPSSTP